MGCPGVLRRLIRSSGLHESAQLSHQRALGDQYRRPVDRSQGYGRTQRRTDQDGKYVDFTNSTPTSSNSISVMPTTLRMLRYAIAIYSSRSRELEARYTERITAHDRKTATKVACFAFWRTRRCVRTYLWSVVRREDQSM